MLFTVLAPEFLIVKSLADRGTVNSSLTELQELAGKDGVPWARAHSLFANMGGFVIKVDVDRTKPPLSPAPSYPDNYHLVASDILALREHGILEKLPSITEEELNDKSKSDGLIRAITIVQIACMVVQITIRSHRHLAISQLELSVLAFAFCAIVIYVLNWEKPKGVKVPYILMRYEGKIPRDVLRHLGDGKWVSAIDSMAYMVSRRYALPNKYHGRPMRNHISHYKQNSNIAKSDVVGLVLGSVVFGAIHIAAWSFSFPTPAEKTIWRIAGIISISPAFICLVFIGILVIIITCVSPNALDTCYTPFTLVGGALAGCGYVVARLFMIVETFRTLFFLPPSAYVATWASNVPHIARGVEN
jgi:hypothetical protein